jgi:hypothetical protein
MAEPQIERLAKRVLTESSVLVPYKSAATKDIARLVCDEADKHLDPPWHAKIAPGGNHHPGEALIFKSYGVESWDFVKLSDEDQVELRALVKAYEPGDKVTADRMAEIIATIPDRS